MAARVRATGNCFDQPFPVICSHPFAANQAALVAEIPWDLVVIDEAHRLRNAHKAEPQDGPSAALGPLQPPQAAAHRHARCRTT